MFDIGFWELAVIGIVALLVIGPEELPALIRTVLSWMGKARQFLSEIKTDLDQEVNKAKELKRLVEEETKIAELHRELSKAERAVLREQNVAAALNADVTATEADARPAGKVPAETSETQADGKTT